MSVLLLKKYCYLIKKNHRTTKIYFFSFPKVFEKQTKTIEDQWKKHVDALEALKSNMQELTIKNVFPKDTYTKLGS